MYKYFIILFTFFSSFFSLKMNNPKLCINCKHFISDNIDNKYGKCALFPIIEYNNYHLVNGNTDEDINHNYCSIARGEETMCGEQGKLYKKKYTSRKKKI